MPQTKPETIKKMRGRLNAVIDLAQRKGIPDDEIAVEIVKAVKAEYGDDAARVLIELHAAEVAANTTDFSAAVADRIHKSKRGDNGGFTVGTFNFDGEKQTVNKRTGKRSTLNDGLTDSERAYAARLRGGKS